MMWMHCMAWHGMALVLHCAWCMVHGLASEIAVGFTLIVLMIDEMK